MTNPIRLPVFAVLVGGRHDSVRNKRPFISDRAVPVSERSTSPRRRYSRSSAMTA